MDSRKEVSSSLTLRPCQHQVAGHLFEAGKEGSLVDDLGHFYKPLQPGPRGERELAFYKRLFRMFRSSSRTGVQHAGADSSSADDQEEFSCRGEGGESQRTDAILEFVPRFSGTIETGGRTLLMLKDVGASYSKPCVIDIKIGYRTWYASADERYIARARAKDQATTQASLGFKICGWQVYKHSKGKICRASKSYCKTMSEAQVDGAFLDFADNERGIRSESVLGMTSGALPQLLDLRKWFQHQTLFHFYSSSILIFYEGLATCPGDLNVRVSMVDFAHTFPVEGNWDDNFLGGLTSLIGKLQAISEDRNARQQKRVYRKRSLSNGESVGLSGWLGRPASMTNDRIMGDGVPTPISSGGET
ncbi:hypothetical protein BSKO_04407 [Bryopsis sp. KO-2023]|nr:hypothetical protein BSKO_04407 [Bryopsis sp. KO-2023]